MKTPLYAVYIIGAALIFGVIGLAVANRVPFPANTLVELAALSAGAWYGLRNAKKSYAKRQAHDA